MATTDGDAEVHRIGFTLLKGSGAPNHGPVRANIVFVHGLRGCPRRTWEVAAADDASFAQSSSKSKRSLIKNIFRPKPPATETTQPGSSSSSSTLTPTPTSSAIFWPNDFLANDLPEARIWTYGYNADAIGGVFQARNKNSISQHGRDLSVHIERDVLSANGYPVLFVAHSLGGIIVKDAINRSQACQNRCKLVVFLGTPHRGSDAADWGIIAANLTKLALQDSNRKVLNGLQVDSEVLDNIHLNFITTLDQSTGRIRVHSFQEARHMTGIKGLSGKVVSDFSSKLDLSRKTETVESIDADHRQMARCPSRSCPQYRAILGILKCAIWAVPSNRGTVTRHVPGSLSSSQMPVKAALPAAEHPSRPCYYIPIPRNRRFVGRQAVLDTLKQKLFVDGESTVSALVGLGGVGKTQVALQLAYWAKETKPELSIFWVPALSDATFRQACADIVKELAIDANGGDDPRALLRQHLDSADAGEWLLIVDNADDDALIFGASSNATEGLINFLPQTESGKTLITTRSMRVAAAVAGSQVEDLGEMSPEDAMDHLEKSLIAKDGVRDTRAAKELLAELEHLPLAITQAAAYLNENRTSISEYLALLRGTPQELISLMSYEFRDTTGYTHSKNAIATTWLVSFEYIRQFDPVAAAILTFISFIQPKAIPRSLLPRCESEERMTRAIGTLCAFSFLSNRGENNVFDMHSLVHMATQIWVRRRRLAAQEAEKAIRHVNAVFPRAKHESRFLWREYMPHALKLLGGTEGHTIAEKYHLFYKVGRCLEVDGRIKEAVWCHEQNYRWCSKNLPKKNNSDRLTAQHNLAWIYRKDGQIQRSLALLAGVLKIREKELPRDDLYRLETQKDVALAHLRNGEFKKAIGLLEEVVRIQEKVLAEDHPIRLSSQHHLAKAYLDNGEVKKTIDLLEVVVGMEEKVLAEDYPDRLASQHELAFAYLANGEVRKAIDLLEVVVRIQEKGLAENHPDRLRSQHVLAKAYLDNGEVQKAIDLQEVVVRTEENVLAEDHPKRLVSQHNLGTMYLKDGQVDRAIRLLEHVVKTRARKYDEGDYLLPQSRKWLEEAYAKRNQGQDIEGRPGDAVAGEDEEARGQDAEGPTESAVAGDGSEAGSTGVGKGSGQ